MKSIAQLKEERQVYIMRQNSLVRKIHRPGKVLSDIIIDDDKQYRILGRIIASYNEEIRERLEVDCRLGRMEA